jgi:hypothetical protein
MAEASRIVLAGFELRSEAKLVRYPERYSDARGAKMWATANRILIEAEGKGGNDERQLRLRSSKVKAGT